MKLEGEHLLLSRFGLPSEQAPGQGPCSLAQVAQGRPTGLEIDVSTLGAFRTLCQVWDALRIEYDTAGRSGGVLHILGETYISRFSPTPVQVATREGAAPLEGRGALRPSFKNVESGFIPDHPMGSTSYQVLYRP